MDEIGEKLDALLNDPKQFGKIAQLASSILGDGADKSAPPSAPEPELDLDMGQLRRMMSALRGGGHDSANRHLLEAMKPYLAEKRRRKIDRAMKLARLAPSAGNNKPPPGLPGGGLQQLLQKFSLADLESEDLLLILVLYLMYRESGDKELLFILGGMLFL